MMFKSRCTLIVGMIFWSLGITSAQSLENFYRIAEENHPGIRAERHESMAIREKVAQVGALPDPVFSAGYFVLPVETRVGPQNLRLSLQQSFPWPGTLKIKEKTAQAEANLQALDADVLLRKVKWELTTAYYQLYRLKKDRLLIEGQVELLQAYESLAVEKYGNGSAKLADVLEVQLKREERVTELNNLASKEKKWLAAFNERLARELDAPVELPDTLVRPLLMEEVSGDSTAARHPEMARIAARKEVLLQEAKAAEKEGKPKLGIGLDYVLVGNRSDASPDGNGRDVLMPMVSLTLPIFNREKYGAMVREKQLMAEATDGRIEAKHRELSAAQTQAFSNMQESVNNMALYGRQILTAKQLATLHLSDFSNGIVPMEEVLRVEERRLGFQRAKLQAELDFFLNLAWLQWARGDF